MADGDSGVATVATAAGAAAGHRYETKPGAVVDGYRIERLIGAGAMGTVYQARDPAGREVALKFGDVDATPAWMQRFEREAHALASVVHPNVVVVHRVGRHGDQVYIAMEYVPATARQWLAAAPRSWREIVAMYAAAGDGLAAAHAAGFVHRDFKPDNVLVGADGRPRVADFGLVTSTSDVLPATVFERLTRTGVAIGTPTYMAPEQLASEPVDARADQFALCACLWEALFGEPPFGRGSMVAVMVEIARGPVQAPSDLRGVPRRIVDTLLRGLSIEREPRFPTVAALVAALRARPRKRTGLLVAGAIAVASGGVAIAAVATRGPSPAPEHRPDAAVARTPPDAARRKVARWVLRGAGTTGGYRFDPRAIDLPAFLAWAHAALKEDVPDAYLVRMSVDGVGPDGGVDLSRPSVSTLSDRPSAIELRFDSTARKQLAACGVRIFASTAGIRITEVGECNDTPVRLPRCTLAQVRARFVAITPEAKDVDNLAVDYYDDDAGQPLWAVHMSAMDTRVIDDAC